MKATDQRKLARALGWHQQGGKWVDPAGNRHAALIFMPDRDAGDDYAVLEWARRIDRAEELADELHKLLVWKGDPAANPESYGLGVEDVVLGYEVGDYARAALRILDRS